MLSITEQNILIRNEAERKKKEKIIQNLILNIENITLNSMLVLAEREFPAIRQES